MNADEYLERAMQFQRQGRLAEALHEAERALGEQPDDIRVLLATSWLYHRSGNAGRAAASYKRIIELQPDHAEALNALGAIYHEHGMLPRAIECYRQAIRARPDYVEALNNLGAALQRVYLMDDAAGSYRRALELEPGHPAWELRIASLCRPVARSNEESDRYRAELLTTLNRFSESGFRASPDELVQTGPYPSYSLMYHGRDDRPVREAYARVFEPCFPKPHAIQASPGRNRIGLVVTGGHEQLFVRSMGGVLRHMDTSRFGLTVVCASGRESLLTEMLDCPQVRVLGIPAQISAAADLLGKEGFDILYYWEIATDPLNYFLPFFRLAPVQCTSWGIQVTSGIPTVDYYLSSRLVEPDNADAHYSETLVRADTLLTYQYRSRLPASIKRREDFGLSRDLHIYLFPQQMGKFHPDFDSIVGDILRRDRQGMLVILQGLWPYTAEQLRARLVETMADVIDQVVFLSRLEHQDLLCLIADSEVLLDPPYYGGVNSSYDGFSVNTPIITSESSHHIGRYTAGCYRKMGLDDCIAPDASSYVEMAVELGTDPERRAEFSERIRGASPALYEDMDAVHEHERIFGELLDCPGR